jgi:hypothetical protein
VFARYIFQKRDQRDGETLEKYITELKLLVKPCEYHDPKEMTRDKIVCGIRNPRIREKLLAEGNSLTLERAVEVCRIYETTQAQLKSFDNNSHHPPIKQEVDVVYRKQPKPADARSRSRGTECYFCGGIYGPGHSCPAKGKTCSKCRKLNHFAKVCCSKVVNAIENDERNQIAETAEEDEILLYAVQQDGSKDEAFVPLKINNQTTVSFKIDTGAQANIIPQHYFDLLAPKPLIQPTKQKLTSYCGSTISTVGTCFLSCSYNGTSEQKHRFFIVGGNSVPILGFKSSKNMNLVKLVLNIDASDDGKSTPDLKPLLEQYKELFSGIGKIQGECEIHLKEGFMPTAYPARKVPIAMREKLKQELDRLESLGIIGKVEEPMEWVNSMVLVEKKDGGVRLCIDPVDLNKAIKRPHYPIPTFEDAIADLSGAKYFSKLDATSGYWSLVLSKAASDLTTFNTIYGRYRWKRYPFGLISAQDEFQRKMEEIFQGLEGLKILVDDLLIYGATREEHDRRLADVLERAKQKGVKFNRSKCQIAVQSVCYFGHIISNAGIKPDPEKLRAINEMPTPKSKEELQTLLGMLNFLSRYIPNLATQNRPLRDLIKANEFEWKELHTTCLNQLKESIVTNLAFFDSSSPTLELEVDASKHGLGARISASGKVFAYASRSLSKSEQNYSQLEKELFAIVYGCRHYHHYLYGRKVQVITDHRPLESILIKPLHTAPPRIQRLMMYIQPYDLTFKYRAGKEIPVADALSRLHLPDIDEELHEEIEIFVHSFVKSIPATGSRLEEIKQGTLTDHELQALKTVILEGWPDNRRRCPNTIVQYWSIRQDLSTHDDLIFKGSRIVIPTTLRDDVLKGLHSAHLGTEKNKQRARMIVYWPGIGKDIETFIRRCDACTHTMSNNQKEPMIPMPIPSLPWQHVGCDLFEWNGKQYAITVDYYSRYFEVDNLASTTTSQVVTKLKGHFARHGIPAILTSDNGPQFSSSEFRLFTKNWGIEHQTSSPYHPTANGLVEKCVQTCKRILNKSKISGQDPYIGILEYRNTPVDGMAAPAQLLMSRQLRSVLPVTQQHLEKNIVPKASFWIHREKYRV